MRRGLAGLAALYFAALVHHPPHLPGLHAVGFFTESTCLFPRANVAVNDYRLDAWSCAARRWAPIDPRVYFPIEADDKESRFQRFGYFYQHNKPALEALDAWITARHPAVADGLDGDIGGIRLSRWTRPIPAPGAVIERYAYRPRDKVPAAERKELFATPAATRHARCPESR